MPARNYRGAMIGEIGIFAGASVECNAYKEGGDWYNTFNFE